MTTKQIVRRCEEREARSRQMMGDEVCLAKGCYSEPHYGEYCETHKHLALTCARCGNRIVEGDVTAGGCCYPCACDVEDETQCE